MCKYVFTLLLLLIPYVAYAQSSVSGTGACPAGMFVTSLVANGPPHCATAGTGSGTVNPGTPGNVPEYVNGTTLGDTGVAWPPRIDQLGSPAQANYDYGGFFTGLHNGTYQQIGATVVYGSANEALNGLIAPHDTNQSACASENLGSTTIATKGSDAGGNFITLSGALSGVPDAGTSLNDTTAGVVLAIVNPTSGNNTTSKLYFASTTGFTVADTVSTGTSMICPAPPGTQAYDLLVVGGALDQTGETFTLPSNWTVLPFLPATEQSRLVVGWSFAITAAAPASFTFTWTVAANGSFIIARVGSANLSTPTENSIGLISANGTTAGTGSPSNNATTDLFLTFVTQNTGATITLPAPVTQGKGIIEDVLYQGVTPPASACDNVNQNAFGYIPPYNNVLFTDPQWGSTYQRMIRIGAGGNVDHNFYYSRNSWNSNHTLMLGLQTPPSGNGTGSPWVMSLFDQNGCFLKPMFNATGSQPTFNWRVNWSKTDPNVFYTGGNGTAGTWPGIGNLNTNHLYAIHPCATAITGSGDAQCTATTTLAVQDMFAFTNLLTTGANFISTNQPTGPSLDEAGTRIGIVTRPTSGSAGDYYFSSLALTNSTTVNPASLRTYDVTAGDPAGYCNSTGEVEKVRYLGNGELIQNAVYRGSGTPSCNVAALDAGMQVIDESTGTQADFLAQDINAPWFTGGGHETWSPHIGTVNGGGYFCYAHGDGDASFALGSCTASANVATCTASGGYNFPKWPIGTNITGRNISVAGYNVTGATTTNGGTATISYTIGTTPGAATGGTLFDGNQWEQHCSSLDGTVDKVVFEGSNLQAAQTVHDFWPWGSPPNSGTVTDFFYSGFAFNGINQYPATPLTTCTHSGATVTCNTAAVPSTWIAPNNANNGIGSLHGSTVYITGVNDGVDQCYNGPQTITATTGTTFQYTAQVCTPGASGSGGTAYVGPTDEIYKCYVNDGTFGTGCVPVARTYSAQVTSDFYFEPLPNGSQEGDLVEFDSAPGSTPAYSFGKIADAKTLLLGTTPPFNASLFYEYAAISPSGTLSSTSSGPFAGFTAVIQAAPGVAPITTYTTAGSLSAQGAQVQTVGAPQQLGDACSEGNPCGALVATTLVNGCKGDVTLSGGTGTFTNTCVTTASACDSRDVTTPANVCTVGIPGTGTVTITGIGTDHCRTVCQ